MYSLICQLLFSGSSTIGALHTVKSAWTEIKVKAQVLLKILFQGALWTDFYISNLKVQCIEVDLCSMYSPRPCATPIDKGYALDLHILRLTYVAYTEVDLCSAEALICHPADKGLCPRPAVCSGWLLLGLQPEALIYHPTDKGYVLDLQEKIEQLLKNKIMEWRSRFITRWNRHCTQIMRKLLPRCVHTRSRLLCHLRIGK